MKKQKIFYIIGIITIVGLIIYNLFINPVKTYSKTYFYLGTIIDITIYENNEEIFDTIEELILSYDNRLDRKKETSEIYQLNQYQKPVSEEILKIIEKSLYYSEISKGYFDISINPIVDLWQIGTVDENIPDEADIQNALSLVDYHNIILEDNVTLLNGATIDLGGIAKGFIADEIVKILDDYNIKHALINLGGNVFAYGESAYGGLWNIGIRNPYPHQSEALLKVMLKNKSVVTSGIYERYLEEDGKIYHHIFNPYTGYPIDNNLISLSVISDYSIDGDALSTSLFALGLDEAFNLAEKLNIEIICITNDHKIYITKSLSDYIEVFDASYEILKK